MTPQKGVISILGLSHIGPFVAITKLTSLNQQAHMAVSATASFITHQMDRP